MRHLLATGLALMTACSSPAAPPPSVTGYYVAHGRTDLGVYLDDLPVPGAFFLTAVDGVGGWWRWPGTYEEVGDSISFRYDSGTPMAGRWLERGVTVLLHAPLASSPKSDRIVFQRVADAPPPGR